ncbi:MAG: 16S rRNA (adenine(1518)-N(6)/adenine(1519)-N(6))-dimethyltransferase RsmA [Pseudomonadota bacterium]
MDDALLEVRRRIDKEPPLREVLAASGFTARKSLGQHFILDQNLTDRIAAGARAPGADPAAPLLGRTVVEIGPGPGGLTRSLLRAGATVIAVEKDERARDALAPLEAAARGRLTLKMADALKSDPQAWAPRGATICANLPYNIATPLIVRWLCAPWPPWWSSATVMVQREVAARLVATVRGKDYGRLAVLAGARAHASPLFDVAPSAFVPPPKVWSTVVRLDPRPDAADVPVNALERVTGAAFGQRRKMLRSSLKSLGDADTLIAEAGLSPTERAERVDVADFIKLAKLLAARD